MSVVGTAATLHTGTTGNFKEEAKREYQIVFQVTVDDKDDGPPTVLQATGLPSTGSTYAMGNETDATAYLYDLSAKRVSGTRLLWHVTAKYKRLSGDDDQDEHTDENGEPQDDPLLWHNQIGVTFQKHTIPVDVAWNLIDIGVPGGAPTGQRPEGRPGPVINSAFTVLDPPLEKEESTMIVRVTKNELTFPQLASGFIDTINSDPFTISKIRYNFFMLFFKNTAKLAGVDGSFQFENNTVFWKNTYELHVNERSFAPAANNAGHPGFEPKGWNEEVLDRGIYGIAVDGLDDGRGGSYTGNPTGAQTGVQRLQSRGGGSVDEPILLNGRGLPATMTDTNTGDPVYLPYRIYQENDFNILGI